MGNGINKIWEWQKEIDENSLKYKLWQLTWYVKDKIFDLTKTEENKISDEELKKIELKKSMTEIKNNPDFVKFKELFNIVKKEYQKNRKITNLSEYLANTWFSYEEKRFFIAFSDEIITKIASKTYTFEKEAWMNNYDLMILKDNDAFFKLWENNFNL